MHIFLNGNISLLVCGTQSIIFLDFANVIIWILKFKNIYKNVIYNKEMLLYYLKE